MQEFMKEYLRRAFETGALDLGYDREMLVGFLRIFSGEMEATIALEHAFDLEEGERQSLIKIAAPTDQSRSEHRAWKKALGM